MKSTVSQFLCHTTVAVRNYYYEGMWPIIKVYRSEGVILYSAAFTNEIVNRFRLEHENGLVADRIWAKVRKAAILFEEYVQTGKIVWKRVRPAPKIPLSPYYQELLRSFCQHEANTRAIRFESLRDEENVCRKFFAYDSLLILLFLAFAAALLLLRYVRTHDSLSVGLDRLKAFVEFDGRFGVVLGAASILLGLKTWEELLHLSLFGLDAQALNPQGIGPLWYLSLLFPDLEVLFWGGLSVLAGWKCRTGYTGGNRLALAGILLAIAAVGVSLTPVGDVLPLLIYTAGL